ncbi:LacI family transcriptional regulator [Actinocorallia herbida]|uniref:LacI family transcriptional regulator n=1 Tax=Actinocorallia herbida TaxID=58109 RepID=A0A3N1D1C2_9ACTN|nr:LacI family DNA-binding transcriptional regulator [Actinocorallia herbida]ROO87335.1 LacI family transcriptional regulator [Actinocorallia herbida]
MTRPAKRPTSSDVARAAGVSQTTVSFVLNNRPGQTIPEETRRRVLEAARQLDYRPHASARALAAGRSDIVLLAVPDLPIGQGISSFIEGLASALAEHNLNLVTHLAGAHGRSLPDVCAAVSASAVVGFGAFDADTVQALHRAGADVVLPTLPDRDAPMMEPVGRLQAEHLIAHGHRRLGYALPAHPGLFPMAEERLQGAVAACADAGAEPPLALTVSLDLDSGAQAVGRWRENGVTAVCAFNDETAMAVLAGMRAHGLAAPGDMAVIGADDIAAARLTAPPLTSVSFDLRQVVERRAAAVVAALAGERRADPGSDIDPRIVLREST